MRFRIIISVIVLVAWLALAIFYNSISGPVEGSMVAEQLQDDNVLYSVSKAVANGYIRTAIHIVFAVVFGIIWLPIVYKNATKPAGDRELQ